MTVTYDRIATTTASGGSTSITFSSIPATYTDLVLVMGGSNSANTDLRMRFNGDTGSNYSATVFFGDGSAANSFRESNQTSLYGAFGPNSNNIINIFNYTNGNTFKSALTRSNMPSTYLFGIIQLWRSTTAINSVTLYVTSGSYNSDVVFTLYGIKAE